jgi:TolB-like protein
MSPLATLPLYRGKRGKKMKNTTTNTDGFAIVKLQTISRRLIAITALVALIGCFFTACAGGAKPAAGSGDMSLDQAIAEAAVRIDERIASGSKIAPINFSSSSDKFSSYVLDELTANLVDSGKLTVVDRKEIDLIRDEFKFQFSGEVGDDSMQDLGRMLGAQSIISGSLTDMGGFYRIVIRVLNVQNASVEVQYRANIVNDTIVAALLTGGRSGGTATVSGGNGTSDSSGGASTMSGSSGGGQTQTVQVPSQSTAQTSAQSKVIVVEGASLTEKLQWIEANAANDTEYRVEVTANESLSAPVLSYPRRRYVTIRLISNGGEKVLSLTGSGSIFTIESDVTLILDNGITLHGRKGNNASLVTVNSRGTLIMNAGAKIACNDSDWVGGGVLVNAKGTFTMTGGEISSNTASSDFRAGGGGVYVAGEGVFTMTGGEISNNTLSGEGGGVKVKGTFTMRGGEISGNTASNGGGVSVGNFDGYGTFTMTGGEILGNTASNGGGVYQRGGSPAPYIFTKTGGTIYGDTGTSNGNRADRGNVAYCDSFYSSDQRIRNSTAGPSIRMDPSKSGAAGGWEN